MRFLAIIFLAILWSCDQKAAQQLEDRLFPGQEETTAESEPISKEVPKQVPLSFAQVDIQRKLDCGAPNCTYVLIQYPKVTTDGYGQVNQKLTSAVNARISNYLREDSQRDTQGLVDQFLLDYQAFKTQFPESTTPWSLEIIGNVLYNSTDFSSIRIQEKAYTGGAHDNSDEQYINLHRDGRILNRYADFFSDVSAIRKLGDAAFRQQKGLRTTQDLAAKGFTFEKNTFQLSENFGFSSSGLTMYYNAYDIGSYAQGPTRLTIPWDNIKPYFSLRRN